MKLSNALSVGLLAVPSVVAWGGMSVTLGWAAVLTTPTRSRSHYHGFYRESLRVEHNTGALPGAVTK